MVLEPYRVSASTASERRRSDSRNVYCALRMDLLVAPPRAAPILNVHQDMRVRSTAMSVGNVMIDCIREEILKIFLNDRLSNRI